MAITTYRLTTSTINAMPQALTDLSDVMAHLPNFVGVTHLGTSIQPPNPVLIITDGMIPEDQLGHLKLEVMS